MKKLKLGIIVASAFAALFATGSSFGAVISITDPVSPFSSISINPGDSFSVNINISTSSAEDLAGLTYFLQISALGSGLFSISDRNAATSQFSDINFTNLQVTTTPFNNLAPTNTRDLGGTLANPSVGLTTGTYFVSSITIQSNVSLGLGAYTLSFSPSTEAFNTLGDSISLNLQSYTVNVIPEPTTMALLAGSLTAIMVLRRRRRIS